MIISRISAIKPFLSATVAMAAAGSLIALDRSISNTESQIIAGLWVILVTMILAMIVQIAHMKKAFSKQLTQVVAQKERLANEIKYRLWTEKISLENKAKLQIIDKNFPAMLAYFNAEQQCCYHNRAFRRWFGLRPEQIDSWFLHEFFNTSFYAGIRYDIKHVLSGEIMQNQHIQQLPNQVACLVAGYLIPHSDSGGKVIGFYTLHTSRLLGRGEKLSGTGKRRSAAGNIKTQKEERIQKLENRSAHHSMRASINSSHIIRAIEQEEFRLYCQKIVPTQPSPNARIYYEILIRLAEEESNLIPPGAFFPFVEKHNLMPHLDRWVVDKAIQCLMEHLTGSKISFCINVAGSTLKDPAFAEHIRQQLIESGIQPQQLCFEIETADAAANLPDTVSFTRKIQQSECQVSLCSFNYDRTSFDLLRHIRADFLKIDGSLICNILGDGEDLKKVEDINRFSHALKIRTIGELVETPDIFNKVTEIGIDYVQGFGVGRLYPLDEIANIHSGNLQ